MAEQDEHRPEPGREHDADRGPGEGAAPDPGNAGDALPGGYGDPAVPGGGVVPGGGAGSGADAEPAAVAPAERRPGPDDPDFDEAAVWAAIVAGYGAEPPDPPGARPFRAVEDLALLDPGPETPAPDPIGDGTGTRPRRPAPGPAADDESTGGPAGPPLRGLGGSVSFAPGLGPRDHVPPQSSGDDADDDEGHFVPPDPPLPAADTTAKFAWLAVIGGSVLLLLAVLLGWELSWWLTTLGIGGFIGGFVTLVVRMDPGDEDDGDPGRGAVV